MQRVDRRRGHEQAATIAEYGRKRRQRRVEDIRHREDGIRPSLCARHHEDRLCAATQARWFRQHGSVHSMNDDDYSTYPPIEGESPSRDGQ